MLKLISLTFKEKYAPRKLKLIYIKTMLLFYHWKCKIFQKPSKQPLFYFCLSLFKYFPRTFQYVDIVLHIGQDCMGNSCTPIISRCLLSRSLWTSSVLISCIYNYICYWIAEPFPVKKKRRIYSTCISLAKKFLESQTCE